MEPRSSEGQQRISTREQLAAEIKEKGPGPVLNNFTTRVIDAGRRFEDIKVELKPPTPEDTYHRRAQDRLFVDLRNGDLNTTYSQLLGPGAEGKGYSDRYLRTTPSKLYEEVDQALANTGVTPEQIQDLYRPIAEHVTLQTEVNRSGTEPDEQTQARLEAAEDKRYDAQGKLYETITPAFLELIDKGYSKTDLAT